MTKEKKNDYLEYFEYVIYFKTWQQKTMAIQANQIKVLTNFKPIVSFHLVTCRVSLIRSCPSRESIGPRVRRLIGGDIGTELALAFV